MSRRIALAFAALVAVLLVAAVIPLGAAMQSREEESFRFTTVSAARQITAAAEETLADHHPPDAMNQAVAEAARRGDCAAVYDPGGVEVAGTNCVVAGDTAAVALAARARSERNQVVGRDGDWLRAAIPVGDNGDAGVVVLARSADPLDDRVEAMWTWLALTGAGCLALGVVLAAALARWVGRPLRGLDAAAARLGDGELDVRAATGAGPAEVRRLAATFNRMAERTQTLVDAHRGWVADVSHQLRTPLTALRLRLDVLAGEVAAAEAAEPSEQGAREPGGEGASTRPPTGPGGAATAAAWQGPDLAAELAGVQEEIGRLSRLVDGLLAVARAEAAVPRREPVPADAVAAERVAAWEPVARENGQALAAVAAGPVRALLAPGDLEQILDNLIANALAAVPAGGHVRVVASAAGRDRVRIRVADDGPGMGEPAKQAAFRRFGTSGGAGSGLGLAIVHRLVTANGGEVRLTDTAGGGLTVEIELPAAGPNP
ncbi:HAMP domain-containing sensor histidine kinase [Catenulispora subtropica]|uniref:histidine kinase n=1 Tax=Catenulispora subtropica TaxID=450798 RepID=A0ABP5ERT2_9ACTN